MTKAQQRQKASSSWAKKSACEGKAAYTNAEAKRRAKTSRFKLVEYRCKFCGWWHVGETLGKMMDKKRQSKLHPESE